MATRSGSVDPGLLLWLLEHDAVAERELADALEHESGLLGLAGSADMREVLRAGRRRRRRAHAGARRLRPPAARGRSPRWRRRSAGSTRWCSPAASASTRRDPAHGPPAGSASSAWRSTPAQSTPPVDGEISAARAAVRTLVIPAREDLEIARQARRVLAG